MTPFLELRGVAARLGGFALEIDANFGDGWTALFGPSGAGKTTLLEVVAGLRRPDEGRVTMGGRVLVDAAQRQEVSPQRRGIGYVPQDLALFPHLSVRANLDYGRPPGDDAGFFEIVVERLEIGALLAQRPGALSGGEKQRVAVARALLARPALLLLDEPLTGLDAALRERILHFLQRVRDEFRVPTLYVTHNADEVMALCERVVVIEAGRVRAEGAVTDLFVPRETPSWRLRQALRLLNPMPSYQEMASTVRILTFGPVRAQLGADRLEVVCPGPLSPDELWARLLDLHPGLKPFCSNIRLARDGEFLAPDARLHPGEEIALIPPVSGG